MNTDIQNKKGNQNQNHDKSWWNKPLWGDQGMIERVTKILNKPPVPEDALFLYGRSMEEMQKHAVLAQNIDSDRFTNQEFLLYVQINRYLNKNLREYAGLQEPFHLLTVALAAKASFLKLEQIELRYRGIKQQEFYQFVDEVLKKKYNKDEFNSLVEEKLAEVIPELLTEEGVNALEAYQNALNNISEFDLGLKLLALFKKYDLTNFTLLTHLSDLVLKLVRNNLEKLHTFEMTVKVNYNLFEQLGKIIGMPKNKDKPESYARLLQYLALNCKHELSYIRFQELLNTLFKWQKVYLDSLAIIETYPKEEYKHPKEFTQEIPGLHLYGKYGKHLD